MRSIRTIAVIALFATACGSGSGNTSDGSEEYAALVESGQELYRADCAVCHGVDLTGASTGPSLLSEVYAPERLSDLSFADAIRMGAPTRYWDFGPMPPIAGFSESDVEAIVAYVRESQSTRSLEPYPPG